MLGHVFVANMTGNVVFLGFALAGAPGFSIVASDVALVSFWFGALVGGEVGSRLRAAPGAAAHGAISIQVALLAVCGAPRRAEREPGPGRLPLPADRGPGARHGNPERHGTKLAVPDLTPPRAHRDHHGNRRGQRHRRGQGIATGRRFLSVSAMFVGALLGAVFVLHVAIVLPLVAALVVLRSSWRSPAVCWGRPDARLGAPVTTFITRYDTSGDGIRLAVKDLIDMEGEPTTAGCRAVAERAVPAPRDAACLAGARAAGARIVGRTNLHELALGVTGINPWYGTPVNPLDPARVPGGSSSGSAVAVATGEADVAYGSDTGGLGAHPRRVLRDGGTQDDVGQDPARSGSGRCRRASTPWARWPATSPGW